MAEAVNVCDLFTSAVQRADLVHEADGFGLNDMCFPRCGARFVWL